MLLVEKGAVSGQYCCVVEVMLHTAQESQEECVNVTVIGMYVQWTPVNTNCLKQILADMKTANGPFSAPVFYSF